MLKELRPTDFSSFFFHMNRYLLLIAAFALLMFQSQAGPGKDTVIVYSLTVKSLNTPWADSTSNPADTCLENIQVIRFGTRLDPFFQDLGNLGQPGLSDRFTSRTDPDFIFEAGNPTSAFTPGPLQWYRTKSPLTSFFYSNGGAKTRKEQMVHVLHTQNAGPAINFGLEYLNVKALGFYSRQTTTAHNSLLWLSYSGTQYGALVQVEMNRFKQLENGGLADDSLYLSGNYEDSQYIPVLLKNAQSRTGISRLRFLQALSIFPKRASVDSIPGARKFGGLKIVHSLDYEEHQRVYYDQQVLPALYPAIWIDSSSTRDQADQKTLTNRLAANMPSVKWGSLAFSLGAALRHQVDRYAFYGKDTSLQSLFLDFRMTDSLKQWLVLATEAEMGLKGFREGDYRGQATLWLRPWKNPAGPSLFARLSLDRKIPSFWMEHYASNHFQWENQFDPTHRYGLSAGLALWRKALEIEASQVMLDRPLYFSTAGFPQQYGDQVHLFSLEARLNFKAGPFHSSTRLLWQKGPGQKVIRFPEVLGHTSNYVEGRLFKKNLLFQFGFEIRYRSAFYPYYWLPATGQFILQDQTSTGNHPFLDLFLNIRIKTVRLFFYYEHLNSGLDAAGSFTYALYPANPGFLRFGLNWMLLN